MPILSRNPEKLESKALDYERRGKTAKALKCREKAARLRGTTGTTAHAVPVASTTTTTSGFSTYRTPQRYEQNATKWEQRGNYTKAQKNREKVWRLNNPNYGANVAAPAFYNNNQFVGYNAPVSTTSTTYTTSTVPVTGVHGTGVPTTGAQHGGLFRKTPEKLEAKALEYERRGKTAKAQKSREKAARLRANSAGNAGALPTTGGFTSFRTPQRYEQNATKWEQRGNYTKAQKNREKVWRLNNPTYDLNTTAPAFYNNNQFVGYNVPLSKGITTQHVLAPTVETHVRPTIVDQTTRAEKITEVQPIIHREVIAPQVHVVEKHLYETVPSTGPSVITKQAIVEETVKPRIIEEIQPVVHREVPVSFVERVEQHVTEHITKPTTMTKEVVNDAHVRQVGVQQAGGLVQQTTTTQTTTTGVLPGGVAPAGTGPLAGVKNAVNQATHH